MYVLTTQSHEAAVRQQIIDLMRLLARDLVKRLRSKQETGSSDDTRNQQGKELSLIKANLCAMPTIY